MADAQDLYSLLDDLDDSALEGKAFITLIGSGHQLSNIKSLIKRKKLKNVQLLKEVDQETYLTILKDADIGLVSLNKKLKSNNFPLKMMGYILMAIINISIYMPGINDLKTLEREIIKRIYNLHS